MRGMDDLPRRILMGPGPSEVPPRVLAAMSQPTIGHLDPAFLALMDRLRDRLRQVFRTENEMTLPVSGTGSAGMEAVLVNLIEPGDRVLVGVNGVFGGRMAEVARRAGAEVSTVEAPWGRTIDRQRFIEAARLARPRLAAIVHAETSTGVCQPLEGLADALHEQDCLLVVDCVTSLGGMPVEIDAWGIDAAYSGTQKCLSCPPGLAPITLSPRAVERLEQRAAPVQSWYLDLTMVRSYWGAERAYHHTPPINMLYALDEACAIVLEEGLEARFVRHRAVHELLRDRLGRRGIEHVSEEGAHLPMLNAVAIPPGMDDAATRRALLDRYDIEIGGGLGELKGSAWRIGLMGESARPKNVLALCAALDELRAG